MATIKEIKEQLANIQRLDDPLLAELEQDSRSGVIQAIAKQKREIQKRIDEDERLEGMLAYEKECYARGMELIAGVDEVGRGPLAGPVVAAAVILPKGCKISGLNDSKKIPKSKHKEIYEAVLQNAIAIGIGVKDNHVIDQDPQPQHLLIDAMKLDLPISQTSIIKGDAISLSIAAASIVAKVTRDQMMEEFDKEYPGYDFAQNAGYGTAKHLAGLEQLGVTPIHRLSFEPVKTMCED